MFVIVGQNLETYATVFWRRGEYGVHGAWISSFDDATKFSHHVRNSQAGRDRVPHRGVVWQWFWTGELPTKEGTT